MILRRHVRGPEVLVLLALIAGCSSTHNFKTDGHSAFGGGFADYQLRPGLYEMIAKGNATPWPSFGAAIDTWRGRADELCGKDAYQEIVTDQDLGKREDIPAYLYPGQKVPLQQFNPTIRGYVLCNTSGMTHKEATKYLKELPAAQAQELALNRRKELDELGGDDCSGSDAGISAETYYRRGKILMDLNEYKPSMSCFLQAQERERDTQVYKESCSAIGMMYELGWGVDKDLPTAMSWYKKAGL